MTVVLTERDLSDPLNREQMRWEMDRLTTPNEHAMWVKKWGAAIVERAENAPDPEEIEELKDQVAELEKDDDALITARSQISDAIRALNKIIRDEEPPEHIEDAIEGVVELLEEIEI